MNQNDMKKSIKIMLIRSGGRDKRVQVDRLHCFLQGRRWVKHLKHEKITDKRKWMTAKKKKNMPDTAAAMMGNRHQVSLVSLNSFSDLWIGVLAQLQAWHVHLSLKCHSLTECRLFLVDVELLAELHRSHSVLNLPFSHLWGVRLGN